MKQNLAFYSACMGMLLFGAVMITLGSVLPEISEKFKLNEIDQGLLIALLPAGVLVGSLVFGPVVDRYGYKSLLIISAFVVLIGMEGIAFANELSMMNLSVFGIGLGGGVLNGATSALVADISEEGKGANLSNLGVYYGLGAVAMPTILNLLKGTISSSQILSVVGVSISFLVILFLITSFPLPKQSKGFPVQEGIRLLKSRPLLVAGIFLFFASGSETLANNWLTTYVHEKISLNPNREQLALVALSSLVLSLTVARFILGKILRKVASKKVFYFSLGIAVSGTVMISLSSGYPGLLLGAILLGGGMGATFPVMLGYVATLFSNLSGTAFSVVLTMALTGSMVINYTVGIMASQKSILILPFVLTACLSIMLLLLSQFFLLTKGKID